MSLEDRLVFQRYIRIAKELLSLSTRKLHPIVSRHPPMLSEGRQIP